MFVSEQFDFSLTWWETLDSFSPDEAHTNFISRSRESIGSIQQSVLAKII